MAPPISRRTSLVLALTLAASPLAAQARRHRRLGRRGAGRRALGAADLPIVAVPSLLKGGAVAHLWGGEKGALNHRKFSRFMRLAQRGSPRSDANIGSTWPMTSANERSR